MNVLFESSPSLLRIAGDMHFHQHHAVVTPQPVLVGDSEIDAHGVSFHGSVHFDQGRYRMWYQAWPAGLKHDSPVVAYAESDDGIQWRKPNLGLVEWNGSKANNLVDLWMHSPTVTVLPDSTYFATGCSDSRYGHVPAGCASPKGGGYFAATSTDGYHWTATSTHPLFTTQLAADNIFSVYHPARRQVQTLFKFCQTYRNIFRRAWSECDWANGQWSQPRQAIVPDDFDDIAAAARGFHCGDIYGISLLPAGRATVGFAQAHISRLPLRPHPCGRDVGVFSVVNLTLLYQHDAGWCWQRMPGRPDFISRGQVDWATAGVYSGGNVITCGNEQRLYVCGTNVSHGVDPCDASEYTKIGYASWPKWRLFGFHADPKGELDIELGELDSPQQLHLNYACQSGGAITVRLHTLDRHQRLQDGVVIPGRDQADATVLTGDGLETLVTWKDGSVIQPQENKRFVARLFLHRAKVYAFETRPPAVN